MRIPLIIVGAVLLIFGIVFALQGFNVMGGSAMSGRTMWAVLGPIVAIIGAVLLHRGLRASPRQ